MIRPSGRPGKLAFSLGEGDEREGQGRLLLFEFLEELLELAGPGRQLLDGLFGIVALVGS